MQKQELNRTLLLMNLLFIKEAKNNNRIFGLDLLRSFAILFVLIGHGNLIIPMLTIDTGYFGVELFFVLSGFLIGTIIIRVYENNINLSSLTNFWLRRWFRTLPNYYLFLFINIVSVFLFKSTAFNSNFVSYFAFLQCINYRTTPIMGESWSLCIEEWFYILFPLWLFFWSRISFNKKKTILFSTLGFILVFTLLRIGAALSFSERSWDFGFRCTTLLRLDSIGYGVIWAWINRYYISFMTKYKNLFFFIGIVGIILSVSLLNGTDIFNKTIIFSLTSISFSLLIPFFCMYKTNNENIKYLVSHISIISYSLYLIHFSIILRILLKIDLPAHITFLLYWGSSMLLSTIVYNLYERKMTALRGKYSLKEVNISHQIVST